MVRVDNVRIKDLMLLLTKLHQNYEVVDIIVDPKSRRVILDPVVVPKVDPNQTITLTDDNIEDLV